MNPNESKWVGCPVGRMGGSLRDFSKSFPEYSEIAKDSYINVDDWYEFISKYIDSLEPYILNVSQKDDSIFIENKLYDKHL